MKRVVLLSCVIVPMLFGLIAAGEQPPAQTNVVYVENAVVKPGQSFSVKVYLNNIDTVSGVQVPIFYRSDKIKLICDSVSFIGSVMEKFQLLDVKIPLTCEKCSTMFINPTKNPGICDKEGCRGKLYQKDQVVYFSTIDNTDLKSNVSPIFPGKGLIATIYFTVPSNSQLGIVNLTRGMIPNSAVSYTFDVWNTMGTDVDAVFNDGKIEVKDVK